MKFRAMCKGRSEIIEAESIQQARELAIETMKIRPLHRDCLQVTPEDPDTTPDWTRECEVCGQTPIVPMTGMCGPCTFGEAETIGGNW